MEIGALKWDIPETPYQCMIVNVPGNYYYGPNVYCYIIDPDNSDEKIAIIELDISNQILRSANYFAVSAKLADDTDGKKKAISYCITNATMLEREYKNERKSENLGWNQGKTDALVKVGMGLPFSFMGNGYFGIRPQDSVAKGLGMIMGTAYTAGMANQGEEASDIIMSMYASKAFGVGGVLANAAITAVRDTGRAHVTDYSWILSWEKTKIEQGSGSSERHGGDSSVKGGFHY